MYTINVKSQKSKRKIVMMVRDLPLMLSGRKKDIYGVRSAFWGGFAHNLYTKIAEAYFNKARLLKDDLGNSWPDISPQTKAYRRTRRPRGPLAMLSSSQRKEWWKIYKQFKAYFITKKNFSEKQAKTQAAKKAWTEIKKQGGKTKIQAFGDKKMLVLIDRGKLFDSLLPGSFNGTQYRTRSRKQIFKVVKTGLIMGTRVKYASRHHEPKKVGFPQRRLWPVNIRPWVKNATQAGILAATRRLATKL